MKPFLVTIAFSTLSLIACTVQQPDNASGSAASSQSSASSAGILMSKRACTPADFRMPMQQTEEWATSWNSDPATIYIPFESSSKEFSVQIPYNPSWGNRDCQLEPYVESGATITFGLAGVFEGGGAMRFNHITVLDKRTASEASAAITAKQDADLAQGILPENPKPILTTINGHAAVQYSTGGFCDQTYTEIEGKKANYLISSVCNVDLAGADAALESIEL